MTDIALHEAETEPVDLESFDNFDARAWSVLKDWAAIHRDLVRAREDIFDRDRDLAIANARIIELERSNAQLHERVGESMSREALAHAESARLQGIMTVTGNSLADGMARPKPAVAPSAFRPRTVP